jgi:acetyl-CoA acetyltransferase
VGSPLTDQTAIVGIGQTEYAKVLPYGETEMAVMAIKAALEDAGIDPSEVDGMASYTMEQNGEAEVARNMGFRDITYFSQVGYGGGAGCGTVGHAAMSVFTGQANVAIAWRSRKRGDPTNRPWAQTTNRVEGLGQWYRPWGLSRPVDEIAMLTRRAMHEYGYTREHLCNVAMAARKHANMNPKATMYEKTMTREQYMNARWISEPLCLFDNCLETDGAVAAVIVRADRAKDCKQTPAYIHSFAQGINSQHVVMTNYHRDDPLYGPAWAAAPKLWANADCGPEDVKVAQLYDAFSPLIPLSLEGYGFCKRGEGGDFTNDGNIEIGGKLPVNTSGAGMSEAYVHGFNLIAEGVRQIRGTSTCQVPDADISLVTSGEGVPTSALILRKK